MKDSSDGGHGIADLVRSARISAENSQSDEGTKIIPACKALKTHETEKSSPAPLREARRGLSRADELGAAPHLTESSPSRRFVAVAMQEQVGAANPGPRGG